MNFEIELRKIDFIDGEADTVKLYDVVEQLKKLPNQRDVIPAIFNFFEKNHDKELGSPGPLIHFLEESDDYQEELKVSVDRKPTVHTVWMINRIINGASGLERAFWIDKLRAICNHPIADNFAKESAREFIAYQSDTI